jgi:N-hydroxyarylamine O-acetyltransferase
MNIKQYLERIQYSEPLNPDVQTFHRLQRSQLQHIPFENLDIGLKRPIRLEEDALWEKIIIHRRGGFCYELNGLFAWLLKEIGFEVTYLNARVYNREGELGIDFDHLALLVQIPGQAGRWIADVGFGDSFTEPLRLEGPEIQEQGLRAYRLERLHKGFAIWQRNYDGSWERHYFFDLRPHRFPEEYLSACNYHQTSPKSSFTRGSIISRATPNGRVSLEDDWLILTRNGLRTERAITNRDQYNTLLQQYFGIKLWTT